MSEGRDQPISSHRVARELFATHGLALPRELNRQDLLELAFILNQTLASAHPELNDFPAPNYIAGYTSVFYARDMAERAGMQHGVPEFADFVHNDRLARRLVHADLSSYSALCTTVERLS